MFAFNRRYSLRLHGAGRYPCGSAGPGDVMKRALWKNDGAERDYVKGFWNQAFRSSGDDPAVESTAGEVDAKSPFERCFWDLIGGLAGKSVLEIGCGRGDDTIRLLRRGATVTSIDISEAAIDFVGKRLQAANLTAELRVMDAFDVNAIDRRFDLIIGRFVLHHLEPFAEIGGLFAGRLQPGGRMIFAENNSRNPVLIFARDHVAGKFGIPRFGDDAEQPLTPEEIATLRAAFRDVACHFPAMCFLQKLNTYVFRHDPRLRPITALIRRMDEALWRFVPGLRPWSYHQIVVAANPIH